MTKTTIGSILIILAVVIGGIFALGRFRQPAKPTVAAVPPPVLTVNAIKPTACQIPLSQSAYGPVAAWQEAVICAEVNGLRLTEVRSQVGETVKKGQVLAVFDDKSVLADVAQSRAALAEAEANLSEARIKSAHAQQVADSGGLSELQVIEYSTSEKAAQAKAQSAKAQLDVQLLKQRHTRVLASDDGMISSRSASLGAVASQGQELYRLIRQHRLEWRGEVNTDELARLKPGLTVNIVVPGLGSVIGKIRTIAPTVDAQNRRGIVYVDLPGATQRGLRPGMFANGEFQLGFSTGLCVPQDALYMRDGFSYVFRLGGQSGDRAKVNQVKVQAGKRFDGRVEILTGVSLGDAIVSNGVSFLADGDSVKVVPQ